MDTLRASTGPRYRVFIVCVALLLVLDLIMLAVLIRDLASGRPDRYPHEQLRLLANSLGGLFLAAALILLWRVRFARLPRLSATLIAAALVTAAWSLYLSM